MKEIYNIHKTIFGSDLKIELIKFLAENKTNFEAVKTLFNLCKQEYNSINSDKIKKIFEVVENFENLEIKGRLYEFFSERDQENKVKYIKLALSNYEELFKEKNDEINLLIQILEIVKSKKMIFKTRLDDFYKYGKNYIDAYGLKYKFNLIIRVC